MSQIKSILGNLFVGGVGSSFAVWFGGHAGELASIGTFIYMIVASIHLCRKKKNEKET